MGQLKESPAQAYDFVPPEDAGIPEAGFELESSKRAHFFLM
jgi:hypothetical protein